ncbi:MAG: CDP-alcohol phosphatidyltransferase family protein [Bryobacteraceae bacterium]|nr:CDP-alcohol phosphatidyltransferase family protein [Bryobacteraceae bacterium]
MRHIPNLLTLLRIALTPMIVLAILDGRLRAALYWCIAAGLSDAVDGWVARQYDAHSRLGQILDPIADKLMQGAVFLTLAWTGAVPVWLVGLVFGRDLMLVAGAFFLWAIGKHTEFPPTFWGKVTTIIQVFTVFFVLAGLDPRVQSFAFAQTTVATTWSGIHYIWRAIAWLRDPRNSPN